MQVYAVMDGGGVKGAALAGCLRAAEDAGIEFIGFGGTSAGSILALLACVGYSGQDLCQLMTTELKLNELLKSVKAPLDRLKELPRDLAGLNWWNVYPTLGKYRATGKALQKDLGLAGCDDFEAALLRLVRAKLGAEIPERFTFSDLRARNLRPLKVVVSDLSSRKPVVFSAVDEDAPVLSAVRGSMSYPFIFKPLIHRERRFVDGGLCSNLPAFVFDKERAQDRRPLIAFDLVSPSKDPPSPYGMGEFVSDLLETALEAGDYLRRQSKDFYRVEIPTPEGIGTLDFDISEEKLRSLVEVGYNRTSQFIFQELAPWTQAETLVERLQALYAPAEDVRFVLQHFADSLSSTLGITSVRASITLPTGRGTRVVVYQVGMDTDPDQDLEIEQDAGCSGQCWVDKAPAYADLDEAAADPESFGLKPQQQAKVRQDRKSMLSVPIFDRIPVGERDNPDPPLLGVLSFDTDRTLAQLGWTVEDGIASNELEQAIQISADWSGIITKVLR
jgi:NTE family protein